MTLPIKAGSQRIPLENFTRFDAIDLENDDDNANAVIMCFRKGQDRVDKIQSGLNEKDDAKFAER